MSQTPSSRELRRDVPVPSQNSDSIWGSDAIAAMIRALDLPYVCLNPGSSFRGLHDSLVNYLGNEHPQILLCLHEEHAVAIAHGYAKVTGKPLGAIVHSNVGLMHATMAIYNAWADRMPVIVMGATGPVDAARRRPWIDWLHTAQDQAALVRHFIKWDAQPASIAASQEALLRARQIAETAPKGPVYVCFDTTLQEMPLDAPPSLPDIERYQPPSTAQPAPQQIQQAADWLRAAKRPFILMGRVSRDEQAWNDRIQLAERLGARVITNLNLPAAFPTNHPLHAAPAGYFLTPDACAQLRTADVVLSLDCLDLAGTLKQAWGDEPIDARVIQVSVDQYLHNGWSMDHQGLPPTDLYILSEPDTAVKMLLEAVQDLPRPSYDRVPRSENAMTSSSDSADSISIAMLAQTLRQETANEKVTLMRLPLGWAGEYWDFEHPLDYLGYDGGAGIGSGPGMAVGSALALKDTDRLPIAIIGDGDFLMGANALWTAANMELPLLIIVANNRSFFNDEVHQERVARQRGRPVENRWIGQRIGDPEPDLAMMARSQGLVGIGPVEKPQELAASLRAGLEELRQGRPVVVDVRVTPGYSAAMVAGLVAKSD